MPQLLYKEGAVLLDAPTTSTPHVKYSGSPKPKPLSVPVRKALPPPKPVQPLKPVPVRKALPSPDESPSMRRWRWSWQ